MKGLNAFLRGNGLKNVRPALYAWFFNFIFSLFIYFGYYKLFADAAGKSTIAADVAGETGIFTFLADIARNYGGSLSLVFSLAVLTALLFIVVSIFLAGGIYSVLVDNERTTFTNLLSSSMEHFRSMLKLLFVNIPNWLATLAVTGIPLVLFLRTNSLVVNERALQMFSYLWIGLAALVFTFSLAVYDLSRIFKIRDEKNVFLSFKDAVVFVFSNKLNIPVIFLLYAFSLLFLYLIYTVLAGFVSVLYTFLIFIVYQGFIMVRYYLKVVLMRAEIELAGDGE